VIYFVRTELTHFATHYVGNKGFDEEKGLKFYKIFYVNEDL